MLATWRVKMFEWNNFSSKVKVNKKETNSDKMRSKDSGLIIRFDSEQNWTPDWENWVAGLKIWILMFLSCTTLIRVS